MSLVNPFFTPLINGFINALLYNGRKTDVVLGSPGGVPLDAN